MRLLPRTSQAEPAASHRPPAHRGLLAFCLVALVALLLVQGFSTKTVGQSGTPGSATAAQAPLAGSEPLLVSNGHGGLVSHEAPIGRRVALTFDDGPSSTWTPKIVAVLRRFHVPATFFMVGAQVSMHPGAARMVHRNGFEIGNHTFTHADLGMLPGWEAAAQVGLTESVVAGTVGVRPRLLRPPYSSTSSAVTPHEERALGALARRGYVIALTTIDPEDWSRPGVSTIVARATPSGQRGGVILMHDGGGNRAETVAALERLIPRLRRRGFRFVFASDLLGVPRSAVEVPAGGAQRLRAQLFVTALRLSRTITAALTLLVLLVGVLVAVRMLAVLAFAVGHVRRTRRIKPDPGFTPPVSIVVPAYNEAVGIGQAVRSLASSDYPQFETIVVDDGSTDGTAAVVEALALPGVRLARQENLGKAAALNHGIAMARHDVIVTVDGDTVFEPGTVRNLVQPLRDPRVGAISGNTKIGNRKGLLGRWQHIEYVTGFNLDRRMYEVFDCVPTVPGAIGAFRREALEAIGGISGATLAEDTDVTMSIGSAGWRVAYADDACAWTEAPSSLGDLWRQRYRWAYGTLQAIWKHRRTVLRRGDRVGRRAIPYLTLFQVVLPLIAPLIDLFAIYGILFLDPVPVLCYWLAFNALQLVLAWYAFRLDGEPVRQIAWLPLQQFVYRQVMYLVVIESVISALAGSRLHWHKLERTGEIELGGRGAPG